MTTSSIHGVGKTGQLLAKHETEFVSYNVRETSSKWINSLNLRPKSKKSLEINTDISLRNIFLDLST